MTAMGGSEVFRLFGTVEVDRAKFAADMQAMGRGAQTFATKLQTGFAKAQGAIERNQAAIRGAGRALTIVGVALTAALTKTGGAAASFEQEMRNVNVIMRESEEEFAETSARVLNLSTELPQTGVVLARALYNIGSSGFKAAEGLHVLEQSAQAAVAGMTDTDVAAKALTTVLNAYGLEASEAGRVSDVLFKTVERGVLTFPELAENLGQVISSAAAAGVPVEHVAAAFATMTKSGINAAEASTALNRAILTFLSPSEEFAAIVREITGEEASAIIQTRGLGGAVEVLNEIAGENPAILANVGLEMRALKAAMSLARGEGVVFQADMEAMADSSGAAAAAFEEQSKAFAVQWDLMKSSLAAAVITIGSQLLPKLRPLVDLIGRIGTAVAEWTKEHPALASALLTAVAGVAALAAVLGPFLILLPSLVAGIALVGPALGAVVAVVMGPVGVVAAIVALAAVLGKVMWDDYVGGAEEASEETRILTERASAAYEIVEELGEKVERTTEETEQYHKALQDLALIFPEVVQGYNDQGEAIFDLTELVDKARVAHERYIHVLRVQANVQRLASVADVTAARQAVSDTRAAIADIEEAWETGLAPIGGRIGEWLREVLGVEGLPTSQRQYEAAIAGANAELRTQITRLRNLEEVERRRREAVGVEPVVPDGDGRPPAGDGDLADALEEVDTRTLELNDSVTRLCATLNVLQEAGIDIGAIILKSFVADTDEANLRVTQFCATMNTLAKAGYNVEDALIAAAEAQGLLSDETAEHNERLLSTIAVLNELGAAGFDFQQATIEAVEETASEIDTIWTNLANTISDKWGDAFVQMRRESGRFIDYMDNLWQSILDVATRYIAQIVGNWLFGLDQMMETGKLGGVLGGAAEAIQTALTGGEREGQEAPAWVGTLSAVGTAFLQASAVYAAATGDWRAAIIRFAASVLIQKLLGLLRVQTTAVETVAAVTMATAAGVQVAAGSAMIIAAGMMVSAAATMAAAKMIPFLGLQHGGIVTKPTPAVVGEKGPEAVIPLSRLSAPQLAGAAALAGGGVAAEAGGVHLHGDLHVALTADSLDPIGITRLATRVVEPLGEALRKSLLAQVVGG